MDNGLLDGRDNTQSQCQKEVSGMLATIGFSHEQEVSPFLDSLSVGGFLAIDIACKELLIAVDMRWSNSFRESASSGKETRKEDGKARAKRQLLKPQGWTVINIHYQDWSDAKLCGHHKKWLREQLDSGVQKSFHTHDLL